MRRQALFVWTMMALLGGVRQAHAVAAAPVRDSADQGIVDQMAQRAPHALELLVQGEALASQGQMERAIPLFRQAKSAYDDSRGLFGRRECEALTSLDRRAEATDACWHALQEGHMPATVAATVRALVSGPTPPSFGDVAQALGLLTRERERAPGQPALAAAMCDVAESIGDGIMLQHCAEELERIAPDYAPTRSARAALAARCPPWRFWAGWLAIAAAALATAADAWRRRARRAASRVRSAGTVVAFAAAAWLAFPTMARADGERWLSKWPVDDQNPESSVPTPQQLKSDPLQGGYWLQDVASKASLASKRGDHKAAVKYYQAMFKAVPTRAISMTKMCEEFEAMGDLDNAVNSCGLALMLEGLTVDDYVHYVRLMLSKPGALSDKEVKAMTNVLTHMKQEEAGRTVANQLDCQLAVRISDVPRLEQCSAALVAVAPDDPATISFQWALALKQSQFGQAQQLVDRAKAAGMKDDNVKSMQQATSAGARHQRWATALTIAGVMILLGAAGYGVTLLARRRAEPAAA